MMLIPQWPSTCRQQPLKACKLVMQGGSPYGAGLLAGGDGSRQPSEYELGYAKYQARTLWLCRRGHICG